MANNILAIKEYVNGAKDDFNGALVDTSLTFEREAGFAIQMLTASDYAMKIALNDRQSVISSVTNIAAIGISLNPAKRQAYLIPRKGKICLDLSYMGLIDLAMQSGSVTLVKAELAYENDAFTLNGIDKEPTHKYSPFSKNRGEIVGVYCTAKTIHGDWVTDCMTKDEVDAIMNRSEAVKSGKSSPWITDYGEMAKKTVVKRAYKYWNKTPQMDKAIHFLNTDGGEGIDFQKEQQPNKADYIDPTPIFDGLYKTKSVEEARRYWAENNGKLANQPTDHDVFKAKCIEYGNSMKPKKNQEAA